MAGARGEVLRFWEGHGYSPAAAAGFAGNVQQESDFQNAPGGGYYQQSGYPASYGQGSVQQQSQHVLENLPRGLVSALQHVRGPREAARLISEQYERPGIPDLANRERYAQEALGEARNARGAGGGLALTGERTPPHLELGALGPEARELLGEILKGRGGPEAPNVSEDVLTRPSTSGGPEQEASAPRVPSAPSAAPQTENIDSMLALVDQLGRAGQNAEVVPGSTRELGLAPGGGGYVNPLPGAARGRTDMGVDLSAKAGSAIRSIGEGRIAHIDPNWYQGQPYVEEELTAGPRKGQDVYYAEQLTPGVREGQRVRAGQKIGTVAPSGTGLEFGFGGGGGRTLAQATTGYSEGQETTAGRQFRAFLEGLGLR